MNVSSLQQLCYFIWLLISCRDARPNMATFQEKRVGCNYYRSGQKGGKVTTNLTRRVTAICSGCQEKPFIRTVFQQIGNQ